MSKKKEMWITSKAKHDIFLEDVNVKVGKGGTVNPFLHNPYLTETQFSQSLESGSLRARLDADLVVLSRRKPNSVVPHDLNRVGHATPEDFVEIKKISKTAVVIDTKEMEVLDEDDLGGFVDYGFEEDKQANVVLKENAVIVEQNQDDVEETAPDAKLEMEVVGSDNTEGNVIVANVKNVEPDTSAPVAKSVVVEPPKDEKPAVKEAKKVQPKAKKQGDAVVVEKKAVGLEEPEEFQGTFDAQIATKDETGAVVMKMKTEEKVSK